MDPSELQPGHSVQHKLTAATAAPKPFSEPERPAILDHDFVMRTGQSGAHVETRSATEGVVVYGKPVNHVLHLLLTVFTCGLWVPVWLLVAATVQGTHHVEPSGASAQPGSFDDVDSSPPPTAPPPEDFSAASGSPLPPVIEAFPDYHDAQKPPPTKVIDSRPVPWPAIVAVGAASIAVILLLVTVSVDPGAVRHLVSPPRPQVTTTTATVTAAPVTQTETVTASPVTETQTATVTVPPPPPGPQAFLADIRSLGFNDNDNPDRQLAQGKGACAQLAGPPRQTVTQVAQTEADYAPNNISFVKADAFAMAAADDLCPQYR